MKRKVLQIIFPSLNKQCIGQYEVQLRAFCVCHKTKLRTYECTFVDKCYLSCSIETKLFVVCEIEEIVTYSISSIHSSVVNINKLYTRNLQLIIIWCTNGFMWTIKCSVFNKLFYHVDNTESFKEMSEEHSCHENYIWPIQDLRSI